VTRATSSLLAVVVVTLALGACGESEEEKAMNTVCDAKDDIATQVDELKSLTAATITTDAVTDNLEAIRDDLQDIGDAQSDLSDDRREEVEAATNEFTSSIRQTAGDFGSSLSAADAKDEAVAALQQLEASYRESLEPLDCE
jgi:hypothetical protein